MKLKRGFWVATGLSMLLIAGCQQTDADTSEETEEQEAVQESVEEQKSEANAESKSESSNAERTYLTEEEDEETLRNAKVELITHMLNSTSNILSHLNKMEPALDDQAELKKLSLECLKLQEELISYTGPVPPEMRESLEGTENGSAVLLHEFCSYGQQLSEGAIEMNDESVASYKEMLGELTGTYDLVLGQIESIAERLEIIES